MPPLDRGVNTAILHIASKLFPCGLDVAPDPPSTYPALVASFDQNRRITVFSGGADRTIYADREVNYAFRAWHDWCHWRGRHDFSVVGETAVWRMQCGHLRALYDDSDQTRRWCAILHAEVVGQRLYYERHGANVDDQRAFVTEQLERQGLAFPTTADGAGTS